MTPIPTAPKHRRLYLLLIALLLVGASSLRFLHLNDTPVHFDEATQSYIFANLLETGTITYDPTHHHGPFTHYLHYLILRPLGISTLDQLQAWQFRLQPALLGTLTLLLLIFTTKRTSGAPHSSSCLLSPVFCILLAGTSSFIAFYHRTAIPETTLTLLALAIPLAALQLLRPAKKITFAIILGVLLASLHATKETAAIIILSYLLALITHPRQLFQQLRRIGIPTLLLIAGTAAITSILLYTQFFKTPSAALDSIRTYFIYQTDIAHNKPIHYYLTGIFTPGEYALLALALLSFLPQLRKTLPPLSNLLALSALIQIAIYSLIPYKTPWLMLTPLILLTPAAAHTLTQLIQLLTTKLLGPSTNEHPSQRKESFHLPKTESPQATDSARLKRAPLYILHSALCICCALGAALNLRTLSGAAHNPADPRIPFTYSPTTLEAHQALTAIAESLSPTDLTAVIGRDYWPIPWYLRQHRNTTGYYDTSPSASDLHPFAQLLYVNDAFYTAPDSSDTAPLTATQLFTLRPGCHVTAQSPLPTRNN